MVDPRQTGEVPQYGTNFRVKYDADPVATPLHRLVVHGCADVGQWLHIGVKEVYLCQQSF